MGWMRVGLKTKGDESGLFCYDFLYTRYQHSLLGDVDGIDEGIIDGMDEGWPEDEVR